MTKLWNALPDDIVTLSSFLAFRRHLSKYILLFNALLSCLYPRVSLYRVPPSSRIRSFMFVCAPPSGSLYNSSIASWLDLLLDAYLERKKNSVFVNPLCSVLSGALDIKAMVLVQVN